MAKHAASSDPLRPFAGLVSLRSRSAFHVGWLCLGLIALPAPAAEFWVAPGGNDAGPGNRAQPLASPAQALRRARELRRLSAAPPPGGIHLILCGGIYPLTNEWRFRPEDSGTAESPTVVEAARGEDPILSGGVAVGPWHRPDVAIPGLPAPAQEHVWVADAPRFGGRILECRQLWVAGRKAQWARSPDAGSMGRLLGWDRGAQEADIPAAPAAAIGNPDGTEMIVQQQWEIAILRLKTLRIDGAVARVTFQQPESRLEFEHPWPQPILPPKGGGAFCLVGAIGFLDQPGEWCQERPGGRIIYWPRADEDLARERVVVPVLQTIVSIEGTLDRPVSYVQFKGIGFEHTAWRRPAAVGHVPLQAGMHLLDAYQLPTPGTPEKATLGDQAWVGRMPAGVAVRGAHHIAFERCRFEQLAASGVDFMRGTHDSVIEGCVFRDVGGNGIQLGSFQAEGVETHVPYNPTDAREVCARVRIADNLVTDCGTEDWGCVGIGAGYARESDIEHNEICNLPYTGISLGWGWTPAKNCMRDNRVYANHVHHVAQRLCDTAGIYTLSAQPGTVISENSVHSITMSPYVDRPSHWFYLYTDEGSSGITVRDNWCPEERFLKNANGPGNVWERNGPMVPAAIRDAAGLEPAFRDLVAADRQMD